MIPYSSRRRTATRWTRAPAPGNAIPAERAAAAARRPFVGERAQAIPGGAMKGSMNFVAIDFETANYQPDSACAVGLVKVVGGEIVDQAVHLIRPPTKRFAFTYIHGLTWEDVAQSDDFGTLWPKLEPLLAGATFLAAHNAPFDRGVVSACCARYGIRAPSLPFRCTVQISRRVWNIHPTKLSDVCAKLCIALNHHEALSDAMACARIVLAAARA
jgi:DNA polymerase-3 subunit epsilon